MRATMKRIATALQASLLAALIGCSSSSRAPEGDVGIVTLPAGTTLSAEPGEPPSLRPATNLALVLERRDGATRLLAADGAYGWTIATLPAPTAVSIECPPESFPLFRKSPDEISPEEGDSQPASARKGTLLGASTKVYPSSHLLLLAPRRFQIVMPTLHVRCGIEGYAPPEWMWFDYSSPSFDAVHGLVRRPFFGPIRWKLLDDDPAPGAPAITFLEDHLTTEPSGTSWTEVHAFYRDPDNPARTLAVYASGTSRLYAFSQPSLRLFFPQYMPYPTRVVSWKGEWFLEVVSIFGDGAYSTLFHITGDGKVAFHPLTRSSGELDEDTHASWGLLDGKLWIARATGPKVTLAGAAASLYLTVLDTTPEYRTPLDPSAAVFPAASNGGWITAIPYSSEADAKQNAAGKAVRRYP